MVIWHGVLYSGFDVNVRIKFARNLQYFWKLVSEFCKYFQVNGNSVEFLHVCNTLQCRCLMGQHIRHLSNFCSSRSNVHYVDLKLKSLVRIDYGK